MPASKLHLSTSWRDRKMSKDSTLLNKKFSQCEKFYSIPFNHSMELRCVQYIVHRFFLTGARWDVAFPRRSTAASQTNPSPGRLFFHRFFCFLILLVSNDFCFCLSSCDGKFFTNGPFSLLSRVLFFLFSLLNYTFLIFLIFYIFSY